MRNWVGFAARVCVLIAGTSIAFAGNDAIAPANIWPQAQSDIPADPDAIFGTLPNGMRYLIKKNTTPARQVAIRLRIAAGSLDETDSEEGLAHFLEHMAFRGSKRLADGDVIKTLEGLGAARGTDTNAFTFPDSTVFAFDIPVNDDAAVDKGLTLSREIASELTLDPKTLDSEREIVLAETRQKDVAALHASKAFVSEALGTRIAEAMTTIGKAEVVRNAKAPLLRRFYDTHYRPELALLVVVGDIDPGTIETKIKARFSDWKAAAPAVKRPDYAVTPHTGLQTKVFSEPGLNESISLNWFSAHDGAPDTVANQHRWIVRNIALAVLNTRLQELAQSANPPFLGAGAAHNVFNTFADSTSLGIAYAPGHAMDALRAAHQAYTDLLRNGVRQSELDRVITNERLSRQVSTVAEKTLPSPTWAGAIIAAQGSNTIIKSLTESQALFEGAVKDLKADQATAALRVAFAGEPLVYITSPTAMENATKDVAAIFAAPQAAQVAQQAETAVVWPYTSFGPPGKAKIEKTIDDLGATFARFPNGVRVTIKPTKFLTGQVFVHVEFGDGKLAFPKDRKNPSWALTGAFIGGGLNRIALADVPKALAGREGNINFAIWDTSFQFNAQTRPADFETELQYLAAQLTDPAWRPEAFQKAQSGMLSGLPQMSATADALFGSQLWTVAHDNDFRWQLPTADEVRSTKLEDVKALLKDALTDGAIEVTVVGDISVDDALKGLATTFGALPKRRVLSAPPVGDERQPVASRNPVVLRYQGAGDQSVAMISWPTTSVFQDPKRQRIQALLTNVLAHRLFDELRTHTGMTYTPGTQMAGSMVTPGYGFVAVYANIPSTRIADFYGAVEKVIADLKTTQVPADELERARGPIIQGLGQARQNNLYWLTNLTNTQIDPRRIDMIRTNLSDFQNATAADLQREAQTYLQSDKAWRLLVVPQSYVLPDGK